MYYLVGGKDYRKGPYNVKFAAGKTTSRLLLPVLDDLIVEANEKFMIVIDQSSLPNGISVGDRNETTVTIIDDDCKCQTPMEFYVCEIRLPFSELAFNF